MSGHGHEEPGQSSSAQISSMSSSPTADVSSTADHQDASHSSSAGVDSDVPLDASRFAKIPPSGDDCACARTNIIYIAPKPKITSGVKLHNSNVIVVVIDV